MRSGALLVGGATLLIVGLLALYGRTAVVDERAFTARATSAFASDEVKEEISDRIAKREIGLEPHLAPLRPALDAAIANLMPDLAPHWQEGVADMHRALFDGGQVELDLPGAGAALRAAVPSESRARTLLPATDPSLFRLGGGRLESGLVDAAPLARRASVWWPVALLGAFALLGAAAWRAPTRRRGARSAALGVAFAGGAIVAATAIARALVLSSFDTSHGDAVVGTIWDAFLGDLRVLGLIAGALGLILAAVFEPGARGDWRPLARQVAAPCGSAARLARAAALLVLAALLLWMPQVPLDLALVTAAGVLVFAASAEVVRLSGLGPLRGSATAAD